MVIKESSDELNPPVIAVDPEATLQSAHSAKDYLALAIATCGVGYLPLAPGTLGSMVGVALYLWIRSALLSPVFGWRTQSGQPEYFLFMAYYSVVTLELAIVLVIALLGIWAASRTERLSAKKDPGKVVIDEVVGQFIALLSIPFAFPGSRLPFIVLAFVLFRVFDIVKPYPARRLESLEGGLGIMADDIVAGAYAGVVVAVAVTVSWYTLREG